MRDVHGKWLDKDRAIEARRLEFEFFRKMDVYTKVPRSMAGDSKVITTRWIDTDKGDAENANYRERLVGREIKTDERPYLFAAIPPLESLRYIVGKCASNQVEVNASVSSARVSNARTSTQKLFDQYS